MIDRGKEMNRVAASVIGLVASLSVSLLALAQEYPSKPVRIIVPFAAGGVADLLPRMVGEKLSQKWGQPVVVENKVGAGGAIGIDAALSAPQDGYTILFVGSTLFTVLPLAQKVNYEPLKDLIPVSITGTNGMVMVVQKDAPFSTLKEFIEYARKNPGKITYSSGGPATNNHLSTAYLAGMEKLDMVHVPFKGGQAALTAVLSKAVDMHFGNSSDLIEPARSGTVKAIAVSTPKRMPQLPNVPTVAETVPGYDYIAWNGYAVTGGVPAEIRSRLAQALLPITRDPQVVATFEKLGIDALGTTPEEALATIRKDIPVYSQIVDIAGVRLK
jgi:tripartite-type tricarboxylate transporter receptor subunit TctC